MPRLVFFGLPGYPPSNMAETSVHAGLWLGESTDWDDDLLKNDGVRQWVSDDIPYMKWKIKFMFQTTNQLMMISGDNDESSG